MKKYLASPPLLSKSVIGGILYLYLMVSESIVSGDLVQAEEGIQKLVYYVNKSLLDAETRYHRMKKMAFSLFLISRKLKHYF